MKRKSCKGELTTQQIVILIVAIASFAIILFLLYRLNLSETSDEQICHNSVVLKSQEKIPLGAKLDCNTKYICISGGGKCENFDAIKTVNIDLKKEDAKEEIMKSLAEEMATCWWMFGEGKIRYAGNGDCAICSAIMFDSEILNYIEEDESFRISYGDFYNYLNELDKNSETYFTYLYSSYNVDIFQENVAHLKIDLDENFILGDGRYNIVTGIITDAIFLPVYYVKSDQMSKLEPKCNKFVTKA